MAAGPSTRKRKNHKDRALWIDKYKDVPRETIVAAGFGLSDDGLPMMKCVECGEVKERTTDFFSAHGVIGDLDKWFSRFFPCMNNSFSHPCMVCWAQKKNLHRLDVENDEWLRNLLSSYPEVKIDWANSQLKKPPGTETCWATGCTLTFQKGNIPFALGIHSTKLQIDKKYSSKNDHDKEDIKPVFRWANCRQTVPGSSRTTVVIIPCLREAYKEMFSQVIEAFEMGRDVLEIRGDARARQMDACCDFGPMTWSAKQYDLKHGLDVQNGLSSSKVLEEVKKHHAICSTSGIVMTSFSACGKRGPFDVHMDRIEDATNSAEPKGHVSGNVEFKCRLFNNDYQITRKDFLLVFLNQLLVPLPDHVRALAQAEYDALPRSSRDAWNHVV